MHLKTFLLNLGGFVTAFCHVNTILEADVLPCVLTSIPSTCLLNYNTNSGGTLDLTDPQISASAFIYSDTCLLLGHKTVTVPGETSILSWGLSFSKPLILGSEKRPNMDWWTPWFAYDGRRYSYEDCACQGAGSSGGHKCSCQFQCNLWVID